MDAHSYIIIGRETSYKLGYIEFPRIQLPLVFTKSVKTIETTVPDSKEFQG